MIVTLTPAAVAAGMTSPKLTRLHGWSLRESGGANPITVRVRDGSGSGQILASIQIGTGLSSQAPPGQAGVTSANGLFIELVGTGTAEGSIFGS